MEGVRGRNNVIRKDSERVRVGGSKRDGGWGAGKREMETAA